MVGVRVNLRYYGCIVIAIIIITAENGGVRRVLQTGRLLHPVTILLLLLLLLLYIIMIVIFLLLPYTVAPVLCTIHKYIRGFHCSQEPSTPRVEVQTRFVDACDLRERKGPYHVKNRRVDRTRRVRPSRRIPCAVGAGLDRDRPRSCSSRCRWRSSTSEVVIVVIPYTHQGRATRSYSSGPFPEL